MQKWDFEKRVYEPYEVCEDWNCPLYSDDMEEAVNCASCGKEMNFGSGYTSLRIHNAFGFGYAVCEDCYKKEWEERMKRHAEYINREEAIQRIRKAAAIVGFENPSVAIDRVIYVIERVPAADVVEVVRCKDCIYWIDEDGVQEKEDGVRYARCNVHNHYIGGKHYGWCPTENDFCSYGERKEGSE